GRARLGTRRRGPHAPARRGTVLGACESGTRSDLARPTPPASGGRGLGGRWGTGRGCRGRRSRERVRTPALGPVARRVTRSRAGRRPHLRGAPRRPTGRG